MAFCNFREQILRGMAALMSPLLEASWLLRRLPVLRTPCCWKAQGKHVENCLGTRCEWRPHPGPSSWLRCQLDTAKWATPANAKWCQRTTSGVWSPHRIMRKNKFLLLKPLSSGVFCYIATGNWNRSSDWLRKESWSLPRKCSVCFMSRRWKCGFERMATMFRVCSGHLPMLILEPRQIFSGKFLNESDDSVPSLFPLLGQGLCPCGDDALPGHRTMPWAGCRL